MMIADFGDFMCGIVWGVRFVGRVLQKSNENKLSYRWPAAAGKLQRGLLSLDPS